MTRSDPLYTTRDYFDMALCALSLAVVMFAAAMGAYQ